jgi:cyanate permease
MKAITAKISPPSQKERSPYFYLAIIVFSYMVVGINMYRLQPILPTIMETLGVAENAAGFLVTCGTIMSVFLTIPSGMLVRKIGIHQAGRIGLLLLFAGSLLGSFFTSYGIIVCVQLIAGTGGALLTVVFPSFISRLFGQRNTLPMGIYNAGQTAAQFLAFNLLPRMTSIGNIKPAWLLTLGVSFLAFAFWVRYTRQAAAIEEPQAQGEERSQETRSILSNGRAVRLAIGGFFNMLSTSCMLGYLSTYLVLERGMMLEQAAGLCSLNALVALACSLGSCAFVQRFGKSKWVYLISIILMSALRVLQVWVPDGLALAAIVILQGLPAMGTTLIHAAAPQRARNLQEQPSVIALVTTGTMSGMAIGSSFFGSLVSTVGYTNAFLILAAVSFLSLIGMMEKSENQTI